MAKSKTKMKCPICGADMNFHAEKLNYEEGRVDPDFGAIVEEVHTCPQCGRIEMRPSE